MLDLIPVNTPPMHRRTPHKPWCNLKTAKAIGKGGLKYDYYKMGGCSCVRYSIYSIGKGADVIKLEDTPANRRCKNTHWVFYHEGEYYYSITLNNLLRVNDGFISISVINDQLVGVCADDNDQPGMEFTSGDMVEINLI